MQRGSVLPRELGAHSAAVREPGKCRPPQTLHLGMDEIAAFIRRLPKAELHLHLEGTITPLTLVELSRRHDRTPLTLAQAEALYKFTDFTGFIEAFKAVTRLLSGPEDYELAAWRMMQRLADQGVVHAEVYISVGVIYMWRNHDPACFEPIFAGLERARNTGAHANEVERLEVYEIVVELDLARTGEHQVDLLGRPMPMGERLPLRRLHGQNIHPGLLGPQLDPRESCLLCLREPELDRAVLDSLQVSLFVSHPRDATTHDTCRGMG